MMPGTKEGNRGIFCTSLEYFPGELRKWAAERGAEVMVPEGWPSDGIVTLTKGNLKVEIAVANPDDCGAVTALNQVWSLKVSDNFFGGEHLLTRWPSGWRLFSPKGPGWE